MAKKEYVNFLEFHSPLLKSGQYDVTLEQTMEIGTETVLSPSPLSKVLYVQGNRFALDPEEIHAVYPHNNSQGDYSAVLPHIVINRSILPWERSVDNGINSTLPWMALLVFDTDDENFVPMAKTISIEELYESSKQSELVVPYFLSGPPSDLEDLLEPGEKKDDPVNVLDIPRSVLSPILPKYSDLKFIAHVRRAVNFKGQYIAFETFHDKLTGITRENALSIWTILQEQGVVVDDKKTGGAYIFPKIFFPNGLQAALTDAGLSTDINVIKSAVQSLKAEFFNGTQNDFDSKAEEKAFIVANRLARPNGNHEVHLVGLFNCYDQTTQSFNFSDSTDEKPIRLISYKSWSFTSNENSLDFLGLAKKLQVGNLGETKEIAGNNSSTKYLDAGFIALPHHLRSGKKTVSFYRGPLAPGKVTTSPSLDNLPVETSDRLLRYDKNSGMLNLSYAAAWELGRKQGLSDQHFSQNLYLLKKQYIQKEKQRNQYLSTAHLPIEDKDKAAPPLFCLHGHSQAVTAVCFSKDGNSIVSTSEDKAVKLWRADTGELIFSVQGHSNTVNALAYSPNENWIASGSSDFNLIIWDAQTGKKMRTIQHSASVNTIDISTDGTTLALGLADHSIILYDTSNFMKIGQLDGHNGPITSLKFSGDEARLISGSGDQTANVWNTNKLQLELTLRGFSVEVTSVDEYLSDSNHLFVVASRDGTTKIFDGKTGIEENSYNSPEGGIQAIRFSSDGLSLLAGTFNHKLIEWNIESGEILEPFTEAHSGAIMALALSPSGEEILTGSVDYKVILWRKSNRSPFRVFYGHHTDTVTAIKTTDDLSIVLTASVDQTVKIWDTETFELIANLEDHQDSILAIDVSPDGEVIATGGSDNKGIIWDAKTFDKRYELTTHQGKVNCIGFSPNSRTIITGSADGTAMLWDTDSGTSFGTLSHENAAVKCFVFSEDGSLIITADDNSKIKVWNGETGVEIRAIDSGQTSINTIDLSGDKLYILSGGEDTTTKIWSVADGSEVVSLIDHHDGPVQAAIFTKDNKRILTGDDKGQIVIWDTATANMLHKTASTGNPIKGFTDHGRIVKYVNSNNGIILNKTSPNNGQFIKQDKRTNTNGLQKASEGPEDILVEWLDKFNDLDNIPYHYLMPNKAFLQEESIQFFQLDPYWIKCLKDGALSLGDTRKPNNEENDLRSFWSNPIGLTNGFLLHSSLVSGFPDLQIRGYTTAYSDKNLHTGGRKPRLFKKLSDKILLCLFDEGLTIQTVDLFLPAGAIHFGFKEVKSGETITYIKDHKDLFGHESGGQFQLQDSVHWNENRVIDFNKMLTQNSSVGDKNLQSSLLEDDKISSEGKEEFQTFTSADFALEMLESTALVRINTA